MAIVTKKLRSKFWKDKYYHRVYPKSVDFWKKSTKKSEFHQNGTRKNTVWPFSKILIVRTYFFPTVSTNQITKCTKHVHFFHETDRNNEMRLLLAFDGKAKMTVLRRDLMPCFIEKWGFRRNHPYFYFWIQKTVNGLRIWD